MQRPILAIALVAIAGCPSMARIEGSGTKASSTRPVAAFSRVEVRTAADVAIKVGAPSVVVETDDNLLSNITTDVDQGVLVISSAKPFSTKLGVTVAVSTP